MKKILLSFAMLMAAVGVWAGDVQLQDAGGTKFVNMPYSGTDTLTLSDASVMAFKVYDDGGAEERYSNSSDGYLLITAPDGYALQLTGTVQTETNWDYLTVYDGTTNEAAVLRENIWSTPSSGDLTDIGIIASTGRSLLLRFQSDGSNNEEGLNLDVTLFKPNEAFPINISSVTGGSMTSDKPTAKFRETVVLTETHEDGYVLKDILVKDVNNRTVEVNGGTWYRVDASFTMPASEVTVTPTFIPATTIADGLFINMLKEGTLTTNISTGVKSFKVYDDGGAEGEYSDGCSSYLVLTVPEGYQIQVTGTIDAENCDKLTFYDGTDDQAPALMENVTSIDSHNLADIGIVTSSGRNMTIYFCSDGSQTDDGYALNVYVFNPNELLPVTISPATGGAMASNVPSAKFNEVITLTETHERGYTLESTTAVDANGTLVAINGGTWYNAAASFIMPIAGVTVTPKFTTATTAEDGLFINMPKEGTLTTDICNGIRSFKVYDDGGTEGEYSDGCDGYLLLQAPIGYRLKVTGTIASETGYDYLSIYDGTEADETKCLLKEFSSPDSKKTTDIGEYGSTARTLLLYFRSDNSQTADGLDLTVELIPITYTLAFDNGQAGATGTMAITGSMESITLTYDAPQNLPATGFSRTAYNFLGWSTAVDGDVVFADKAEVVNLATEQDAVVTIYGRWQPIVYPVTYDLAGGDVASANPAEYTIESADFTLTNPTREGYTFTGWEGTDLTEKTLAVTVTTGHYDDRAYTATWEPIQYKVHFDINGGNGGTMADQNHVYDSELALTENAFTRTGYTFEGWNTAADGSADSYADKASVKNLTAENNATVTMYAQWKAITYTITYDLDGGSVATANPAEYTIESADFTLTNPTREGYTFTGWTGTDLTEPTETVTIAAGSIGDRSYTATWEVAYTLGDINDDGAVDVSDYIGVANRILGLEQAIFNEKAGDVNEDGRIDVSDYIGVANIILTGNANGTSLSRTTRHANQMKAAADTDLSTYDNVIYMAPQTVTPGKTVTLSICMKNTAAIRGFQFDMYLPDGVTLMKDNKDRYICSLNKVRLDVGGKHTLTLAEQPDGAIRFLVGSMNHETFTGNDGELMTIEIDVAANLSDGDYPIILKTMKLSETDISKYYETAEVQTTLKVTTTTGIAALRAQYGQNVQIFTLSGKKVNDVRKGNVYIVNGNKVVIK